MDSLEEATVINRWYYQCQLCTISATALYCDPIRNICDWCMPELGRMEEREGMELVKTQKLNPGESIAFRRPMGSEAGVFVSMDYSVVETYEKDGYVKVIIKYERPFKQRDSKPPNCS